MLIDGKTRNAVAGETSELVNPATGDVTAHVPRGGQADVDLAVESAAAAFGSGVWTGMSADERSKILWRASELIDAHADELAAMETTQMGVPLSIAKVMMGFAAEAFRYNAGWPTKITGESTDLSNETSNGFAYTRREPVGVVGLIVPWNAPAALGSWKISSALAAGCSAVLKPSEETPSTALHIAALLLEAGLPEGVLNVVTGGGEAGAAIAGHRRIDKVSFTGSTATGQKIIQAASGNFKRLTLELGGKSACVILADADIDAAIATAAQAMYFNSGQICTAGQRIYVQRPVYEKVLAGLVEMAENIPLGDPMDAGTAMGPLVSRRQFDNVSRAIAGAREAGAQICAGGMRAGDRGFFYRPTVISGVHRDMAIMREETFGPALCVVPFDEPADIIEEINDTPYGLAGYIWTNRLDAAHDLAARIKAGMIWINSGSRIDYNVPLGGFKASGWGRENGKDGVLAYLETKSVVLTLQGR